MGGYCLLDVVLLLVLYLFDQRYRETTLGKKRSERALPSSRNPSSMPLRESTHAVRSSRELRRYLAGCSSRARAHTRSLELPRVVARSYDS